MDQKPAEQPIAVSAVPSPEVPPQKVEPKVELKEIIRKRPGLFANLGVGEEKDYFIENLGMLLMAGMNILSSLDAIKGEMRSSRMKQIIDDLKKDIDAGLFLWRGLDKTGLFPPHIISLIRIGEESGQLSENLKVIVLNQQKDRVLKSKIRSAMMYPVLILCLTMVIGIGIAWFILPRLTSVFTQMNLKLPLITRILIAIGEFLKDYGWIAVPIFLVAFIGTFYFVFVAPKSKGIGQSLLFSTPVVKKLIQEIELARAGFILGTLLGAGLSVVDSLDSLYNASTYVFYKKFYLYLKNNVEEGKSFQESFVAYPKMRRLIPSHIQGMIEASEQSGKMSETFSKIGEIFEEKTETTTKNLAVLLEPIMLVIIWLGVVMVALAVIMPIYSLVGGINK